MGKVDKAHFQGLASPSAAAVMAGFVWLSTDHQLDGTVLAVPALIITVATGALMVSNIRYRSFKELDLKGPVPFVKVLSVVMLFVLISISPPQILFVSFLLYAISGPVFTLIQLRKHRAARFTVDNPNSTLRKRSAADD